MKQRESTGMSLIEMIAVIAMIAAITAVVLPRVVGDTDAAQVAACHVYKGDIEIQAELWNHNTNSWPAGNLADIGADIVYFPEGLPVCPVDGTAYTIDPTNGRVIGHSH